MLVDSTLPVIDRAGVERLFGLRRRQAIDLMSRLGGYQASRTFLVAREHLIAQLDSIVAGGDYCWETRRREQLASSIEDIHHKRQSEAVRIPVSPDVFGSRIKTLEKDVVLRPGKLEIEFAGPEDLLRKLFTLAQAIANDYAGFERIAVGGREQTPARGDSLEGW